MADENLMEFSTADAEDSPCRATSRSSILRVPKPNQDAASVLKRRVSFASSSTVKPFAADPDKVTIWDTTYEEEMNNDSSKMSEDKSLEIDAMNTSSFFYSDNDAVFTHSKMEANTKKLKWPKGKKEFLMDKENFYIHKNDSVPYISSNQVQIYEDSTCNSDMSITMGSIQIESNQTKSAMEEMAFSHGLYENVGGSNKMCNTQGINHSMELTSNLPSVNILCSKIGSDNKKPLSVLPTESSVEPENMQQMDQSMQLTANLPVTNLISSNIKIAQTEKDLISIGSDDNKLPLGLPVISGEQGQTNIQITDESLQLTANLPTGNLIITNANILQTVTDMTEVGVTDTDISVNIFENYPRLDKPDMSQLEQSMQLTANLSNVIKTNINVTQRKSDVLSVESNDQELSAALPNTCEDSKQAINSQQVAQNLQLTDLHANANVVQTETHMTRTEITNMDISVSSHGKSQGLEKPDKFQLEQSMQFTTNLSNVIITNINVTQRKSDVLSVESNDQELSPALPNNCEELKQVINSQQIDKNLQLTDPHLNANVVQTESSTTRTGITDMDSSVSSHGKSQGLEKPDKFQSEQSMQLTSNLSNVIMTNINVMQRKSDVLSVESNNQELSAALPNNCEELKQVINSQQIDQNLQLTDPHLNANVVQTESNMTRTGITNMDISVSSYGKSQGLEKPDKFQSEQSMQLTSNLSNVITTNINVTQRKSDVLIVESNDQELSAALPNNCEELKQVINSQQIDQNLQLTDPHLNANVVQTESNMTRTGITNMDISVSSYGKSQGLEKPDKFQSEQSMQLTSNLSNLVRSNINVAQRKSGVLSIGSNDQQSSVASPNICEKLKQANNSPRIEQNHQLTNPYANVVQTETNMTKTGLTDMNISVSLPEKSQRLEKPNNSQLEQSMQLTTDLPVGNSLRTTTTITERKRGILRVGSNNKDLSTATPDNCKRSKQSISPHQTNESMQLTANLPISNLFRPNTNVKQNESDKLIVGSNALPDNYNNSEQTVDTQQMIQSMQLTADLPVTNIFSTKTNSAHKEADATKLKSDLMEFTFGLSEKLDLSRGPTNTNVFIENMELTSDLPVVPITRKSLSSPSKLFCEISGTVDTTSDLLKPVDSSKKGITNLDEEAAIRSLQLTSLSRDTSVDDVTKLRNNTRIFHGLYECTPSSTNFNRKNRQTFKNVQVHPTSFVQAVKNQKLDINESSSNLPAVVKNEVSSTKNETVEELLASLPLHENEDIESILNEVGMDNRNESFQFSEAGLRETDRLQTYSNKEDLSEVTPKDVKQVLTESVISDKQVTQQNTTFPFSQQTFVKINSAENPSSILTNEIPSTNNETVEGLPSTLLVNKNELHPILSEVSINRQIERQNLQCSDAKLGEISIPQIFSNKENLSEITLPHIEQALTERVNLDKLLVQHPQSFPFCQKANTTQSFSNIEIPSESLPELDESVLSIQQNENVEFVNVETEQTFSNRDTSKDILKVVQTQLKYKECLKQVVSFNENSEVVPHLDLTLENPHDNPTLTEFSIENVEIGLEESGHTRFEVHGRVDTINLKRALLEVSKHVKAELEQMMTLMDAERMDIFKKEVEANYAMTYYWDQIAIKLDEREKMIKNILDEKSYLQKAAPNKRIREKFEMLMNTNSLEDKHGEPCGSATTKTTTTLEEKVTELFESSKKCWRFCGTSKNKQRYYFTAMYETIPFEVHIIPNTSTVCDVKGYQNIKANASTLCKYNATLLESHLSKENLSAALGPNYDLLTLLDYVYMTMEQIFSFHQHILDLRKNHGTLKLQIDADFNVSFEIVNVNSLIWWVFTLKLSRTTIGHYDGLEMRSRNFTKENAKEIEGIAQGVSKGPEFLKDFIGNVIDYVNNYTKTYIIE